MPRRFLAIILFLASGCSTWPGGDANKEQPGSLHISPERLNLEDFQAYFSNRIEAVADDIVELNLSPGISRNAILLKMRVIPLSRLVLNRADDRAAYLNIWLVCEQLSYQAQLGEAKEFYGSAGPMLVATAQELAETARNMGPGFLTEAQLAKAEKAVTAQAKSAARELGRVSPEEVNQWNHAVGSVLGKPTRAVRATLGDFNPTSGLSDTAAAIERMAILVRLLQRQADSLPQEMRWSVQLLELELTEDQHLVSVIDSFAKVSDSSVVLADTVRNLPIQIRDEVSQLLTGFDSRQAGLQEMLDRADAIVTSTDQTAQSLTKMGEVFTELVGTLTKTIEELDKPSAEPAAERGPPFDINDYRRTLDELTGTAGALSGLLTQVQQLTSPEEASSLTRVLDSAVRRTLVSLGLFVLFVALVMLGYRWASRHAT